MKYIVAILTLLLMCQCKQNGDTAAVSTPIEKSEQKDQNVDLRIETKKLLRELNNLENSIQGALALSQIARQRSTDENIRTLATVIDTNSEDVLTSISRLSASTQVAIGDTRNANARSVEQAFATMPTDELDSKYTDWVAKYTQRLENSHKAISNKTVLDKSELLERLAAYTATIKSKV